jgi:glycosyltransferase involved in cell wall biosynthesis
MPAISVLLPVRNAQPYLAASLASLRRQTFTDFEIVAVDDGSTDDSGETLERAARVEPRLRVIHTVHAGLPAALNTGLHAARGTLIARHDADDLSHRTRLELQHAFMVRARSTAVVGSRLRLFPAPAVGLGMRRWARWHNALLTHDDMAREVLIDSPLAHGTAMIRRRRLDRVGGWRDLGWPEDLDLWVRLLASGARFAKLPEVLYGWRQHRSSATRRDPRYRRPQFVRLKLDALRNGFLRRVPRATLVGVGESLARARVAIATLGTALDVKECGRPSAAVTSALRPPVVLVFMAPEARERWRAALSEHGLREGSEFIFVC